jgi:hypothetical protein
MCVCLQMLLHMHVALHCAAPSWPLVGVEHAQEVCGQCNGQQICRIERESSSTLAGQAETPGPCMRGCARMPRCRDPLYCAMYVMFLLADVATSCKFHLALRCTLLYNCCCCHAERVQAVCASKAASKTVFRLAHILRCAAKDVYLLEWSTHA